MQHVRGWGLDPFAPFAKWHPDIFRPPGRLASLKPHLTLPPQGLVGLLKQHVPSRCPPGPGASVARRAADAITNLAHENVGIKCRVRAEGGVPPLVALLESFDAKVGAPMMLMQEVSEVSIQGA